MLLISRGKQFIKIDISLTPAICNATKQLYTSKGFICVYRILHVENLKSVKALNELATVKIDIKDYVNHYRKLKPKKRR